MLVATFEAVWVVGIGGACDPEEPRYAEFKNGTPEAVVRVVRHTCARRPGGKLPCASATYSTQVAGKA